MVESQVLSNVSMKVSQLAEEEVEMEYQNQIKIKSFRKFNELGLNQRKSN